MSIAIDTGGTFTDVVFYDEHKRVYWSAKVSSNPDNPEIPFIEGLNKVWNVHIDPSRPEMI